MSHDNWNEQAELYALGALEAGECRTVEEHLKSCVECTRLYRDTQNALTALPRSLASAAPSPAVKSALMRRVAADAPASVAAAGASSRSLVALGMLVLALFGATGYLGLRVVSLTAQEEGLSAERETLSTQTRRADEIRALLDNPAVKLVRFNNLTPDGKANAVLLWNPTQCKGLLLGSGFPQTQLGKAYEFWAIEKGKPTAAGVFKVSPDGTCEFSASPPMALEAFDQFAVSIEDEVGVSAPQGPIVMSGALSPAAA